MDLGLVLSWVDSINEDSYNEYLENSKFFESLHMDVEELAELEFEKVKMEVLEEGLTKMEVLEEVNEKDELEVEDSEVQDHLVMMRIT